MKRVFPATYTFSGGLTLTDLDVDSFSVVLSFLDISSQFSTSLTCQELRRSALCCSDLGRLTTIESQLSELSSAASTQGALRRLPGLSSLVPEHRTVLKLSCGFWNGRVFDTFVPFCSRMYSCNLSPSLVDAAYEVGTAKLGFNFRTDVAWNYEDFNLSPAHLKKFKELFQELLESEPFFNEAGQKLEEYSQYAEAEECWFCLWWLVVAFGNPTVRYQQHPKPGGYFRGGRGCYQGGWGSVGGGRDASRGDDGRSPLPGFDFAERNIGGFGKHTY